MASANSCCFSFGLCLVLALLLLTDMRSGGVISEYLLLISSVISVFLFSGFIYVFFFKVLRGNLMVLLPYTWPLSCVWICY